MKSKPKQNSFRQKNMAEVYILRVLSSR